MRFSVIAIPAFILCTLLVSCSPAKPEKKLSVREVLTSSEPIVPEKPLPQFSTYFGTGAKVLYSYVVLENTETMTGSFPVRLRWFYPNDLRPPMAQHTVTMEPGQEIAQFEIHNENGLMQGPYMLIPAIGSNESSLTETGSWRFFIGMTPEEATQFVMDEEEYKRKKEEEMQRREEEEKAKSGSGEELGIGEEGDVGVLGDVGGGGEEKEEGEEIGNREEEEPQPEPQPLPAEARSAKAGQPEGLPPSLTGE